MDEQAVEVIAPTAPHSHTVVFMHGRGDNAPNFMRALHYSRDSTNRTLAEAFPSFRWVFPQAKTSPCAAFPGQAMSQWFDVFNVADFTLREELQAVGLRESVAGLRALLGREAALLGGRWNNVVLAGISQGAATSVHTLLNLAAGQSLGAFLGFSCRMPFPGRTLADTRSILDLEGKPNDIDDDAVRNTPVLLEHCVDDPLVLVAGGRSLRDQLKGYGAQVAWNEYPDGGHWFNSPAGIDDAVQFLSSVLSPAQAQAQGGPGAMDTS